MPTSDLRAVSVVVPAHDEEGLLPAALAALALAVDEAGVPVDVTVVANACSDRTAAIARDHGVIVVETGLANVGAARAAGCAAAIERHGSAGLWLATTDADSEVPAGWLLAHVACARSARDVRVGMISLAAADAVGLERWSTAYEQQAVAGPHHGHVHGANLGARATTYAAIGGFRSLRCGEDVDLVARAVGHGAAIDWAVDARVSTSARRTGRAPAGVAFDLTDASEQRIA